MTSDEQRHEEWVTDRGHWLVSIRPLPYEEARVERLGELEAIVSEASVLLRGWDFPHVDRHAPVNRSDDHISQSSRWRDYLEDWRLYKSGQFASRTSIPSDWFEAVPTGWHLSDDFLTTPHLGVGEALFRLAEIFHFARNLASSQLGGMSSTINIGLRKTQGRSLWVDDPRRAGFMTPRTATVQSIDLERHLTTDQLLADPNGLAVDASLDVFELFGWEPDRALLVNQLESLSSGSG